MQAEHEHYELELWMQFALVLLPTTQVLGCERGGCDETSQTLKCKGEAEEAHQATEDQEQEQIWTIRTFEDIRQDDLNKN